MKYLTLVIALLVGQSVSSEPVHLGEEVNLSLPEGWQVVGDATNFPFLLMPEARDAEVLVFRSVIDGSSTIDDQAALKMSVNRVVDSVIMTLPKAKLLTSTGLYEGDRARFIVEFTAEESAEEGTFRHNLTGILYRTPDGKQILYSLWGRASLDKYVSYQPGLAAIAAGFNYSLSHKSDVFVVRQKRPIYYAAPVALLLLTVAWIQVRKGQKKEQNLLEEGRPAADNVST